MGHLGADFPYHPGKFMAWDQRIARSFEFPIEKMDICTADTTSPHIEGDLSLTRTGIGQFFDFEGAGFFNYDCFHLLSLLGRNKNAAYPALGLIGLRSGNTGHRIRHHLMAWI
jgi:hypothetical protein